MNFRLVIKFNEKCFISNLKSILPFRHQKNESCVESNTQFRTVKEFRTCRIKIELKGENTKMCGIKIEIKGKNKTRVRK